MGVLHLDHCQRHHNPVVALLLSFSYISHAEQSNCQGEGYGKKFDYIEDQCIVSYSFVLGP